MSWNPDQRRHQQSRNAKVDNPSTPEKTLQPCAELPEPRIIPRPEHSLSRKNVDDDALKVLYRLHKHGYTAYLVGGSVRDLLLGRKPKDFDIGTNAHPGQVRRLFHNSRIIGRRFRLVQVFFAGGKIIEVSTFRRAAEADPEQCADGSDDQLLANNTFGSPAEDALRRDLTINAMFYNIADFSLVDYVGGLDDLRAGLIRAVGDAKLRFHRDPVRVLRAIRHAARTGFSLTPETAEAVESCRHELMVCPESRIRDEIMRDIKGGAAEAWVELAHETKVLYSLLPELERDYAQDGPRAQCREIMGRIDRLLAQGKPPEDAVVLAAFLWAALRRRMDEVDLPEGRAGRSQWIITTRELLAELVRPVSFAKRVVERAGQISGVMGHAILAQPGDRLPKRVTDKGYFPDALALSELLGLGLGEMVRAQPKGPSKKRRRRRRRPRKKKPGNQGQA